MAPGIIEERKSPAPALNGKEPDLCFTGETKGGNVRETGLRTGGVSPVKPTLSGRVYGV